jgi:hypothetical protein
MIYDYKKKMTYRYVMLFALWSCMFGGRSVVDEPAPIFIPIWRQVKINYHCLSDEVEKTGGIRFKIVWRLN